MEITKMGTLIPTNPIMAFMIPEIAQRTTNAPMTDAIPETDR